MAESTLTLGLPDFRLAVSEFLYGGDGDYTKNSPFEQDRIDRTIAEGLRQFYNPPVMEGQTEAHVWSFLTPIGSVTLNAPYNTGTVQIVSGVVTLTGGTWPAWAASAQLMIAGIDYAVSVRTDNTHITLADTTQNVNAGTTYSLHEDDYALPDDFSTIMGQITFRPSDNAYELVSLVGEGRIRAMRQAKVYAGYSINQPWMAAIQQQVMDPTLGTRNKMLFWPRVANAGVASFPYRVRPAMLTPTNLYPYGASDHGDTIMASIMSTAEKRDEQQRGVYYDDFLRKLAASINIDSRTNRPEALGYNGDNSDELGLNTHRHQWPNLPVYKGFGHV